MRTFKKLLQEHDPYDKVHENIESVVIGNEGELKVVVNGAVLGHLDYTIEDNNKIHVHTVEVEEQGLEKKLWSALREIVEDQDLEIIREENYLSDKEKFLGKPKITTMANASKLIPSATKSMEKIKAKPWLEGEFLGYHFTIKRQDEKYGGTYTVFDGDKAIAKYNGDTLIVSKKYRKLGIATQLVVDFRTRHPEVEPARTRNKVSQHIQQKAWDIIKNRNLNEGLIQEISSDDLDDAWTTFEGYYNSGVNNRRKRFYEQSDNKIKNISFDFLRKNMIDFDFVVQSHVGQHGEKFDERELVPKEFLNNPVIFLRGGNGKYMVLDGVHRLMTRYFMKLKTVFALIIRLNDVNIS